MGIYAGDTNFYRYADNDPPNVTDPSGLEGMPNSIKDVFARLDSDLKKFGEMAGFAFDYYADQADALMSVGAHEVPQFKRLRGRVEFMKLLREKDRDGADMLSDVRILSKKEGVGTSGRFPDAKWFTTKFGPQSGLQGWFVSATGIGWVHYWHPSPGAERAPGHVLFQYQGPDANDITFIQFGCATLKVESEMVGQPGVTTSTLVPGEQRTTNSNIVLQYTTDTSRPNWIIDAKKIAVSPNYIESGSAGYRDAYSVTMLDAPSMSLTMIREKLKDLTPDNWGMRGNPIGLQGMALGALAGGPAVGGHGNGQLTSLVATVHFRTFILKKGLAGQMPIALVRWTSTSRWKVGDSNPQEPVAEIVEFLPDCSGYSELGRMAELVRQQAPFNWFRSWFLHPVGP